MKHSTSEVYSSACSTFIDWLAAQDVKLHCFADRDDLFLYISLLFDDNPRRGNRQKCINIYSGLEHFIPSTQQPFRASLIAVRGLNRLVPAKPPLPIP